MNSHPVSHVPDGLPVVEYAAPRKVISAIALALIVFAINIFAALGAGGSVAVMGVAIGVVGALLFCSVFVRFLGRSPILAADAVGIYMRPHRLFAPSMFISWSDISRVRIRSGLPKVLSVTYSGGNDGRIKTVNVPVAFIAVDEQDVLNALARLAAGRVFIEGASVVVQPDRH